MKDLKMPKVMMKRCSSVYKDTIKFCMRTDKDKIYRRGDVVEPADTLASGASRWF